MQKLPAEYRLSLVLHDMEELSDEDTSEIHRPPTGDYSRAAAPRATLRAQGASETRPASSAPSDGETRPRNTTPLTLRQRRCKEIFAELSNYLDDELDDSLCEELEKHMDGCEPCKAFLSSLEKSIQQCHMARNESPDPRIAARLRQKLMTEYQELMRKQPDRRPATGIAPQ